MSYYKIDSAILTEIADEARTKTSTSSNVKAKNIPALLHRIDMMQKMNCVPHDLENGYYGVRAAKVAESYLYARQVDGVVWNYAVNGIFYNHSASGSDDGSSDDIGDDVDDSENDSSSDSQNSHFNGYDPSATSGYRLYGYAARPIGKTPNIIGNMIDCSTFVSLVLRGIPYSNSPWVVYGDPANGVYTWNPANIVNLCGNEGWEQRELDYQPAGLYNNIGISGYSSVRTAADLASYYYRAGRVLYDRPIYTCEDRAQNVPTQNEIISLLQPGDLIFWSNRTNIAASGEDPSYVMSQPNRFRCVSHVAIVSTNIMRTLEVTHGRAATSLPNAIYYRTIRNEGNVHRLDGITLVIRPDYRPKKPKEATPIGVNLCTYPWTFAQVRTSSNNGFTRTITGMNTIHFNGHADSAITLGIKGSSENPDNRLTLSPGTYRLSGMDNTGITSTACALQVRYYNNGQWEDFGTPVRCYSGHNADFTLSSETDVKVSLYIGAGQSLDCDICPSLVRIS